VHRDKTKAGLDRQAAKDMMCQDGLTPLPSFCDRIFERGRRLGERRQRRRPIEGTITGTCFPWRPRAGRELSTAEDLAEIPELEPGPHPRWRANADALAPIYLAAYRDIRKPQMLGDLPR
jgi:hypothetical protein